MQFYLIENTLTDNQDESFIKLINELPGSECVRSFRRHYSNIFDNLNKKNENSYTFIHDVSFDGTDINVSLISIIGNDINKDRYLEEVISSTSSFLSNDEISELKYDALKDCLCNRIQSPNVRKIFTRNGVSTHHIVDLHHDLEGCIEEKWSKSQIYKEAKKALCDDTLIPELDRIFMGSKIQAKGHPVHYIIESDDISFCNRVTDILIQALVSVGRIENTRYSVYFLDNFRHNPGTGKDDYIINTNGAIVLLIKNESGEDNDCASYNVEMIRRNFVNASKFKNEVQSIICLPRECSKLKEILFDCVDNMSFVEIRENDFSDKSAKVQLRSFARADKIKVDNELYRDIEKGKTYLPNDLKRFYKSWYANKLKTDVYPQYKDVMSSGKAQLKEKTKGDAYQELMSMIGLKNAKEVLDDIISFNKAQKVFFDRGITCTDHSRHMVFTGNPGTCKTTVARLLAQILYDNGILTNPGIVEVGRGDLVGKYVGWTAPTVQKYFKQAEGGILFIDEAYSLVDDRDGMYGDEAINTIVQEMENHRDNTIVIFAGYPDKMEKFIQKNPGLRSRIAFHVPFDDYNEDELCQIASYMIKKDGMTFSPDAMSKLSALFATSSKQADFGNGRYVRNVIEKARMAQSRRIIQLDVDKLSDSDIKLIKAEDISDPMMKKAEIKKFGFAV